MPNHEITGSSRAPVFPRCSDHLVGTRALTEAVCSRRRVLELGAVQIGYQLGPSKSGASVRSPLPCCLLPGAGSPQTEQSLSLLQVWR